MSINHYDFLLFFYISLKFKKLSLQKRIPTRLCASLRLRARRNPFLPLHQSLFFVRAELVLFYETELISDIRVAEICLCSREYREKNFVTSKYLIFKSITTQTEITYFFACALRRLRSDYALKNM